MDYNEFLQQKIKRAQSVGFQPGELSPLLYDFQRDIVARACEVGRYAIFADCGMGKTAMQLAWADQITKQTGGSVLIVAPLAVAPQTVREGEKFGIRVVQRREQAGHVEPIEITNYEMVDKFDPARYVGVVLDESSILKSFMGKTKRQISAMFSSTRYRLACTATPSPNNLMELLNHADFLGIMRSSEALAEWFIADQSQSGTYRLKGHAARDFWQWVSTWAAALTKPSDFGDYSDAEFVLPELIERDVVVNVDITEGATETLFRDVSMSATGFHAEKVRTLRARCEKAAEIARNASGQCVVWCYRNDEADELRALLPDAVEVRGNDSIDQKERAILDFVDGKTQILISKPSMFGFGLNLQNCHECVFCGMDYSYEGYYQAIRRFYRFGQHHDVTVWRVLGETELNILSTIGTKAAMHKEMTESIASAMLNPQKHKNRFVIRGRTSAINKPEWMLSNGNE